MAIQTTYLDELATYTNAQVTKIKINDSITITSFDLKHVVDNKFEIKFTVLQSDTTIITNIKMLKTDNTVICSRDVNIPIPLDEVVLRETITISEV